jgi:hypothetical protein
MRAANGTFTVVDGTADADGAGVEVLNDGRLPAEEDQPRRDFFFNAGSDRGRLLLGGKSISIKQINSFRGVRMRARRKLGGEVSFRK